MPQRVKQGKGETPLLVTDVIHSSGDDNRSRKSTFWPSEAEVILEGPDEISGKTDQHEAEKALGLVVLQDKPMENYFEGTKKKKKIRKRKIKHGRVVIPPSDLFSDGAQTLSKGGRKQEALTKEENTDIKLLDLKIYEYEKMREEAHKKNYVRQRMAEEEYTCQLENLAAKWLEIKKRSQVTKNVEVDLGFPKSFPEEIPRKRTVNETSVTSRECCSDNPEASPGKSVKVLEICQPIQPKATDYGLGDEFYEKLVFVDEESD